MNTLELLEAAIEQRLVLNLIYDGKERVVEPHALGFNKKEDAVLRCYQRDGDSATNPRSWKLLTVGKIIALSESGVSFDQPRAGYKAGDSAMVKIIIELPEPETV